MAKKSRARRSGERRRTGRRREDKMLAQLAHDITEIKRAVASRSHDAAPRRTGDVFKIVDKKRAKRKRGNGALVVAFITEKGKASRAQVIRMLNEQAGLNAHDARWYLWDLVRSGVAVPA